ncbi:hypothetical protein CLV91_2744 [Maribacter vaceletii]|uniref:Uncharacterized protein n=1 Tax=Maribacter vaceletii TaxID=1206816 RepID=A0A495DUW7_9FLAO|nr:pyridoxamine 5'-phosphate oxidase family protein [Maribacter vaceletii]RKR07979.1 hypothetical protein CLV91_2744 [Maribacter vaceletii]
MDTAYHQGEIELQKRFGGTDIAGRASRVIKDKIIPGAIPFIENQPFVILSSKDSNENIWTSILIGKSGWIDAKKEGLIKFFLDKMNSIDSDNIIKEIKSNDQVGMIVIELGTRRRYRINGRIQHHNTHLDFIIQEAYPNCPKYIQRRIPSFVNTEKELISSINGATLNSMQKLWIAQSDTFFVGSQSKSGFLDASHRGGNPGFIEILENGDLKIPDYHGNSMYNTLGNLLETPKAGLLFIDFEKGSILQLTGTTSFLFDQFSDKDKVNTTETGRYWLFKTEAWIQTNKHHKVDWELIDNSPFNPNHV